MHEPIPVESSVDQILAWLDAQDFHPRSFGTPVVGAFDVDLACQPEPHERLFRLHLTLAGSAPLLIGSCSAISTQRFRARPIWPTWRSSAPRRCDVSRAVSQQLWSRG